MNINRNNYEEYFLLYADKELSAADKNMVEMFIQQNPDLEEELIMLQQSIIKPDNTIVLEDKKSLFKEEKFIDKNNYEEKFLLYADNELTLSEIEETEKFVLSNPDLQNDFTLLQQAKYERDTTIVFPDKRSLYKKEEDIKVIPFGWKALAAAVLLGIGLWTGINHLQKNKPVDVVTKDRTISPGKKIIINKTVEQHKDPQSLATVINKSDVVIPKTSIKKHGNAVDKKQSLVQENVAVKNVDKKKIPEVDKLPLPKNEDVVLNQPHYKSDPVTSSISVEKPVTTTSNQSDINLTSSLSSQNNNAKNASYINEANEKSENYVFYNITTEQFNKSKIGTFLKRVKRTIERKNPLKDNKSND